MAKEIIMNNVREKLSKARENCVGMSEEVYAVTDYLSTITNDELFPMGMVLGLVLLMEDVRSGFASTPEEQRPMYLMEHKNQVLSQMHYVLQVIDEIAEPEFAEEVRAICKEVLNWNPPKRAKAQLDDSYPAYVRAAVDWWANAIASPKFDNGAEMSEFLMQLLYSSNKSYSEEEVRLFKTTLADEIMEEVQKYGNCYLRVDYHPCNLLAIAGNKIGVSPVSGWPVKTNMTISKALVKVSAGYCAPYETIWTK